MDSYIGVTDSLVLRAEKMNKLLGTTRKRLEKLYSGLRREREGRRAKLGIEIGIGDSVSSSIL